MTEVKFFADELSVTGFEISGHSSENCEDLEGKIVCSAISSAAYMAANTIIEIVRDKAQTDVDDAYMRVKVISPSKTSRDLLEGFMLHITELKKQFNNRIKITTEV
ncbi:MAG: ribosomal-processing cysteine protease Prp [Clostridia bacterium]|nr:ribosomal-processing cysteine protease Prp [Clostridia bacterium]